MFSQEVLCISLTFCEQIVQLQELFGQKREDPATDHFTFEKDLISFSHLITEMKRKENTAHSLGRLRGDPIEFSEAEKAY